MSTSPSSTSSSSTPELDPAAAWARLAPPPNSAQLLAERAWEPQAERAWEHQVAMAPPAEWRWGWSFWVGIHYGPIPVGFIGVLLVLLLRAAA